MTFIAICLLGSYQVQYSSKHFEEVFEFAKVAMEKGYSCEVQQKNLRKENEGE